ncbi:MAG: biotin--[acetyl-CoA-carboxylase] ligase [Candidatus Margulisiibacteriota bacterium]
MIIGKKIIHLPLVDSTNDEAKRAILSGEGEGVVVIADAQEKGRGKPGQSWYSPKGNLYLSAVIKPHKNPKDLAPITLLSGIAARSAIIEGAELYPIIKWPNDILFDGKKIGGILVERVSSGHLILGIGININSQKDAFPKELEGFATSLKIITGKDFSIDAIIKLLIEKLDAAYLAYLNKI